MASMAPGECALHVYPDRVPGKVSSLGVRGRLWMVAIDFRFCLSIAYQQSIGAIHTRLPGFAPCIA